MPALPRGVRVGLAITLTTLAVSQTAEARAGEPHGVLPTLALHRADLPAGAQRYVSRFWTNAQVAARDHTRPGVYQRHGRVVSYEDSFSRPLRGSRLIVSGVDLARCEITIFLRGSGARWYFRWLLPKLQRDVVAGTTTAGTRFGQAIHGFPYHRISLPAIGSQDAAFSASWAADEFAYRMRAILLRQGRYVVLLHVNGLDGRTPLSVLETIARRIDRRILHAQL